MVMLLLRNLINVKRIAYKNVREDSVDFFVEKCYRYYSKTYHTPLEEAYKLPIEKVCQVFMEDEMIEYTSDQMEDVLSAINNKLEPVLQFVDETESEALDDDAWIAKQNLELQQEETKKKKELEQAEIIKKTHEAIAALTSDLNSIKKDVNEQ
jgi:Lon protease-like protein